MGKQSTLERIKKLASQLPPEQRLELFSYLAAFPDSGLIYHPPVPENTSTVLPSDHTQDVLLMNVQLGWNTSKDGTHTYSYNGREVMGIKFNPENYAESAFQQLQDKALQLTLSEEGRARLHSSIEEHAKRSDLTLTDSQFQNLEQEVLQHYAHQLLRDSIVSLANNIETHLNDAAMAILAKILQISGGSVANLLRDSLGVPHTKLKASDIKNLAYKAEFDRLKIITGLRSTQGGPRNVKHDWTPDELDCLVKNYQELQPIWREAKQIARAAQKSQEASRRQNWQAEVLRAYPDLPNDLLKRFNHVRADDAKPSDIALIHAKIKCGVVETYTPRELSDKIRSWNLKKKNRNSPKS
jgi:hypothetical protein